MSKNKNKDKQQQVVVKSDDTLKINGQDMKFVDLPDQDEEVAKDSEDTKPKSRVFELPIPELSLAEAKAILAVDEEEGSDVSDQNTAIIFRRMQSLISGYGRFFEFHKAKRKATRDEDAPYFRITVTKLGIELAKNKIEASKKLSKGLS